MKFFNFLFLLLLISYGGCNELGPGFGIKSPGNTYPTNLYSEWEYNTKYTIQYYDSIGNIIDTETIELGNSVVRVTKTSDTVGTYKNLIKFESYDVSTPWNKGYNWYSNNESEFLIIAYLNAGSAQSITPKVGHKKYLTHDEFKSLINFSEHSYLALPTDESSDSILYFDPPRRVLAYPLSVNRRWIELINPWYRERYVDKNETLEFNGQPVNCFKIKIDWNEFRNIEFNDYISLELGLIKREIISDSVLFISDPNYPDSGIFGRIYQVSDLIRMEK